MKDAQEHKFSEVKFEEFTDKGEFGGYASVFGQVDQSGDIIQKGAFKNSLSVRGPKMLFQHDPSQPIGVWEEIREDEHGLRVRGRILTKTSKGAEVLELMREKILDGLSIGFRTTKAERDERSGIRKLLEVDLWEISVVTFPMLMSATIDFVKGEWTKRDVERVLRDAGMPNAMAVKFVSGGWNAANSSKTQRDADLVDINQLLGQMTRMMRDAST